MDADKNDRAGKAEAGTKLTGSKYTGPNLGLAKMPVALPKYCRNLVEVAGALGIRLYTVRLKRGGQLEKLKSEIRNPKSEFPAQIAVGKRKCWVRAEVVEWGKARLSVGVSGREWELVPKRAAFNLQPSTLKAGAAGTERGARSGPPEAGMLPGQGAAAPQFGFEEKLKRFAPDYQQRLIVMYEAWLRGEEKNKDQRRELEDAGLIEKAAGAEGGQEDIILGGCDGAANWVNLTFAGQLRRLVGKMDVSNWQNCKFLPASAKARNEPFPPPHGSGRNSKLAVRQWIEAHWLAAAPEPELPGSSDLHVDYEREQKKLNFTRAKEEFNVWQKANSDAYVSRLEARASTIKALKDYHAIVKRKLERGLGLAVCGRLRAQGFDGNQLALIAAALGSCGRDGIMEIEDECTRAAEALAPS